MPPFLLLPLLAAPTWAASPDADEIARSDALLSAFDAVFTPADVGEVTATTGRPLCVTGLVEALKDDWHLLPAADRQRVTHLLTPWKVDLADEPPRSAAVPGHEDSCHGQYGAYQLLGEHFVVEWDSTRVAEYAPGFLEALEYAWDKEVEEYGWNMPNSTPDYPILAYIYDYSSYAGAYTSVEYCSGYGYVPYIVAYSGSFSWDVWADDMAAHEFNHAIQFSTALALDFWFWESTATWVEDDVYPSHNTWSDYVSAYTEQPWIAQNAWSQDDYEIFYHMYGMAIFNFYLEEYVGGHELVRDMWNWAGDHSWGYMEEPLWNVAAGMGYDWGEWMRGFMAVATVMDFTDRAYFPSVRIQDTVTELPSSGTSVPATEPESLGQNFVVFDDGLFASREALHVTFDGEDGVPWYVILVAEEGHAVGETVVMEVDDLGMGEAWIAPRDGDVTMVVSPWDDQAYGNEYNWSRTPSYAYTWTAELAEPPPPEDTGPTEDTSDGDTDGGDSEGDGDGIGLPSCGCAAAPASSPRGAFAGLLLAAAALLRRRRS